MKKFSEWIGTVREAAEAKKSELQKSYQDYFQAKLAKYGVESPADLDEEKKKEFFNEISADWDAGKGVKPAAKEKVEKEKEEAGIKEGDDVNEADAKTEDAKAEALVKMIIKSNPRFKWLKTDLPNNYTLADVEEILNSNGYGQEYDKHIKRITEGEVPAAKPAEETEELPKAEDTPESKEVKAAEPKKEEEQGTEVNKEGDIDTEKDVK